MIVVVKLGSTDETTVLIDVSLSVSLDWQFSQNIARAVTFVSVEFQRWPPFCAISLQRLSLLALMEVLDSILAAAEAADSIEGTLEVDNMGCTYCTSLDLEQLV